MSDTKLDSSKQFNFEAAENQCKRLLALLQKRSVNTLEIRDIGIMAAAARILDLRRQGFNIVTRKAKITTASCVTYVAEYVLLPSEDKE